MESNQDVFISHSSADSKLAYDMCDYLEEKGISCWIAPRDIPGGVKYGKSIIMGVKTCKIMVVLFNNKANASKGVENEVERAFHYKLTLIPFKLDETTPSDSLEFSFGSFQWLNATKGNPEDHFDLLYQNCARALGKKESPIKEKPILPLTHEKKESPIKEKSDHYQEEKNSLANKENESKKKKSIILIASLVAIALISIFFYMRKNLKVDEGEVTIGKQIWTTKNLDVETYCNGDAIPQVQDAAAWKNLKTGAWCYYENKTANATKYGKLYNWYAVSDPRGLAPKGYHIPTDKEWMILTDYLGGESQAGTKLKSSSGWQNNGNGTNASGFAGFPGGFRSNDGNFFDIGADGNWWSSSEYLTSIAWYSYLDYSNGNVYGDSSNKPYGFSVRCLRDQSNSSVEVAIGNQRDQSNSIIEVTIGKQVWIKENLDVSTYCTGDAIPQVQDANVWANLSIGAWCYYQNKTENGIKYGKLYNWYAVNDPRGLAPIGYHIPTDKEWTTLTDYLGGESEAGTKMKSSSGWKNNGNGTNAIGFAGLPGGYRVSSGNFKYIGDIGAWWSSSENFIDYAWCRCLYYIDGKVNNYKNYKQNGFSVRCLRY